jgi:hypothetical protein
MSRTHLTRGVGQHAQHARPRAQAIQHQQQAVRLDRAGQVDQLAFTVGQVGLTEGGAVVVHDGRETVN